MPEAVIIDAVRTPIGALGGALSAVNPVRSARVMAWRRFAWGLARGKPPSSSG